MTLYRKTNFHPTNLFLRYKGNTEEIAALEEGVKKYGKGKFEKILKSSDFGPILEGRMAGELKLKLSMVKKLRKEGKEVTSDAEEEDEEERKKEQEDEKEEASIRRECEFKFNTFLNKFAQNSIYQVYLRLLHTYRTNSVRVNHCIVKLFYRLTQLILDEWRDEDDKKVVVTHEPVLFQLSTLMVFNQILNDRQIVKKRGFQELIEFSKSTVRHFFRMAQKNPLMYVEALFNRHRRANEAIISVYDQDAGSSRSDRRKQNMDPDFDPTKSSNALNEADLDGEEEATFDASKYGKLAKTRAEALAKAADDKKRSRRQSRRWTHQEDALLQTKFPQLRHLDAVYEILSFEELLQDKDRTPSQIKNRVKSLGLLDGTVNRTTQEGIFGISDVMLKKQVAKILDLHVMQGAAATENAGREALKTLDNRLNACVKFREEQEELRLTMKAMGDEYDEDDELAMAGSVGFALVPVTQDEFAQLSNRWVHSLLRTLKFREPATGECFWRIPGALNAKECRDRLALLRRTIREIELKEDDSMSNEVGYDDGMKDYDANEAKSMPKSPVDVNEAEDDENSVKIVSTKKYFLESALGMMLSASIQGKISADRISSGLWETFRFEDFGGNNFFIKSHHGHYLSVDSNKGVCSADASKQPGENEKFFIEYKDHKLLLKHTRSGTYLSATDDGKVECNSSMIGSTAMWRAVVSNAGGDDETLIETSSVKNSSPETGNEHTKTKKRRIASLYESSDDDDSDDEFARISRW